MFRFRDIVAIFAALVLTRVAWNTDVLDAVGASVHLSWYLPIHSSSAGSKIMITPQLLDIDGDGTPEALVVAREDKLLQIFDLRKASSTQWLAPFAPPILIQSEAVPLPSDAHPLYLATGHIYMKEDERKDTSATAKDVRDDRTRHYYCGSDWHDASSKCRTHCPGGLSSECPDGETCYADTPCDALSNADTEKDKQRELDVMFTPEGSLPSVATLWENGAVTLHAMAVSNTTRKIELSLLWTTNLLANYTILNWENEHLELLDAKTADNGHGLVILTGSVDMDYRDGEEPLRVSFVAALNAKTGSVRWETLSENELMHPKPKLPLPMRGDSVSSIARRRSLRPDINHQLHQSQQETNCLHFYRRSILTSGVLPFLYWNYASAQSKALHFDPQHRLERQHYHAKHSKAKAWFVGKRKSSHYHRPMLHLGKPNVVATSNENGLQLRSLKNGRMLCHLSLWEEALYADLNHDGAIDSASIVTGRKRLRDDDEQGEERQWISELVGKIAKVEGNVVKQVDEEIESQASIEAHLCHLQVLSGLPAKEELFSTNVCGPTHLQDANDVGYAVAAPPLIVEAIHGRANDIIAAVSTGYITRVHGGSGRIMWQADKSRCQNFPTWEEDATPVVARIKSSRLVPESRPVLLLGENSFTLFSARHGKLLASALFPQPSHSLSIKSLVADFSGDGTSDVIVATDDALWGYSIHIQMGSSLMLRVLVGLLLMLIMLALLRNRFGPQPGRRSSDA